MICFLVQSISEAAAVIPVRPTINASKTFYTDDTEWIDLQCGPWNKTRYVAFTIATIPVGTTVMFNSSFNNPIPALFEGRVKINPTNNGILFSVKNQKIGTLPIYCEVNRVVSPPIQLNYITKVFLNVSSDTFTPSVNINCAFQMFPKFNYDLAVDYYIGNHYLGSISEKNGSDGIGYGQTISNTLQNIQISGRYNPQYMMTLTQTGTLGNESYHCILNNRDVESNTFTSELVEIYGNSQYNSAAVYFSLFSAVFSIIVLSVQHL